MFPNTSSLTPNFPGHLPRTITSRLLSNDPHTGTTLLQPYMLEELEYPALAEARAAEFLHQPPLDPEQRLLESRWLRIRQAKKSMDAEFWRAEAERIEAVTKSVDEDRRKQMLDEVMEQRDADLLASEAQNKEYLATLAAAIKAQADSAWRRQAEARLRKSTAAINAEIAQRERRIFASKLRNTART